MSKRTEAEEYERLIDSAVGELRKLRELRNDPMEGRVELRFDRVASRHQDDIVRALNRLFPGATTRNMSGGVVLEWPTKGGVGVNSIEEETWCIERMASGRWESIHETDSWDEALTVYAQGRNNMGSQRIVSNSDNEVRRTFHDASGDRWLYFIDMIVERLDGLIDRAAIVSAPTSALAGRICAQRDALILLVTDMLPTIAIVDRVAGAGTRHVPSSHDGYKQRFVDILTLGTGE
ncbi:hypothetical protein LCGC14_1468400 [marine sediment metagenome]|uniref:Uncharacterized protein n=1 Tax=marine sediment metagenome TaxID=412755 RepID=A0A0F9MEY2_9ZZZZ